MSRPATSGGLPPVAPETIGTLAQESQGRGLTWTCRDYEALQAPVRPPLLAIAPASVGALSIEADKLRFLPFRQPRRCFFPAIGTAGICFAKRWVSRARQALPKGATPLPRPEASSRPCRRQRRGRRVAHQTSSDDGSQASHYQA